MVDDPAAAVEAAFKVRTPLPPPGAAMLAGANVPVTPLGNPLTDIPMADLKPFTAAVEKVSFTELPRITVALTVLKVKVKLGTATVKAIVAVRASPPPVPLITTEALLAVALLAAVKVTVTGNAAVMVGREKRAVTPVGAPLALNVAGELNPPCPNSVIVALADPPGATDRLEMLGVSVKFDWRPSLQ